MISFLIRNSYDFWIDRVDLFPGFGTQLFSFIKSNASNAMILIDLPPLLSTDDALIMAARVDACLLVVSEGRSRRDAAAKALELLEDFNLAGIVLNRSKTMVTDYYTAY